MLINKLENIFQKCIYVKVKFRLSKPPAGEYSL